MFKDCSSGLFKITRRRSERPGALRGRSGVIGPKRKETEARCANLDLGLNIPSASVPFAVGPSVRKRPESPRTSPSNLEHSRSFPDGADKARTPPTTNEDKRHLNISTQNSNFSPKDPHLQPKRPRWFPSGPDRTRAASTAPSLTRMVPRPVSIIPERTQSLTSTFDRARILNIKSFSTMSTPKKENRGEEFFRYEKLCLKYLGIWITNEDSIGYKIYSFVVVFVFTCVYSFILFYDCVTLNFYDVLDCWDALIGYVAILYINVIWRYNTNKISDFLQKIGTKITFAIFTRTSSAFTGTYFVSVWLQLAYSLMLRYTKTDTDEWRLGYGSVHVVNVKRSPNFELYSVYQTASIIYAFVILQNDLKIMANGEDARVMDEKIKTFVNNHLQVLALIKEVSTIYGKTILATFLGMLGVICLDIYRMSELSIQDVGGIRIFLEVLTGLQSIFFICLAAENIERENERLTNAVYDVNFVGTSLNLRKSLIVIMQQTQKPIGMKALGIMNVSLITFGAIVRTIFSTYTMLKTVNSDGN
ncbi:hypothetical protein FQR65_LT03523 [Abscondita terminalis]|nr:hypothetical protein FQR65_LT03523 [Abscondita terminalis]